MTEDRDWLKVGARVAVYTQHRGSRTGGVSFAKVERIGKRDVVLSDGGRFNVTTLRRSGSDQWGPFVELRRADDPRVIESIRMARIGNARRTAEIALRAWVDTGDNAHGIAAVLALAKALPEGSIQDALGGQS